MTDLRRIASLFLLELHKQLSSERLALLATRPKYSVRNLLGVRGGAEQRTEIAFPSPRAGRAASALTSTRPGEAGVIGVKAILFTRGWEGEW
ncbi:MAG: hypothetical protein FWD69_15905, partial [Polyangiaceae bacterium]|nr:hypothetical protein [Polyangiaceae bacterium]